MWAFGRPSCFAAESDGYEGNLEARGSANTHDALRALQFAAAHLPTRRDLAHAVQALGGLDQRVGERAKGVNGVLFELNTLGG